MFEAPNIRKQILIQGAVLIDKAYGRDCLSTDTHVRYLLMEAILPQSDRRGVEGLKRKYHHRNHPPLYQKIPVKLS